MEGIDGCAPGLEEEDEQQRRELVKRAEKVLRPIAPRIREYGAQFFIRFADGREIELQFSDY